MAELTKEKVEGMSNLAALREYFSDARPKLGMQELKDLGQADREELGKLAKIELLARF